jgi:hypothetical protein
MFPAQNAMQLICSVTINKKEETILFAHLSKENRQRAQIWNRVTRHYIQQIKQTS